MENELNSDIPQEVNLNGHRYVLEPKAETPPELPAQWKHAPDFKTWHATSGARLVHNLYAIPAQPRPADYIERDGATWRAGEWTDCTEGKSDWMARKGSSLFPRRYLANPEYFNGWRWTAVREELERKIRLLRIRLGKGSTRWHWRDTTGRWWECPARTAVSELMHGKPIRLGAPKQGQQR